MVKKQDINSLNNNKQYGSLQKFLHLKCTEKEHLSTFLVEPKCIDPFFQHQFGAITCSFLLREMFLICSKHSFKNWNEFPLKNSQKFALCKFWVRIFSQCWILYHLIGVFWIVAAYMGLPRIGFRIWYVTMDNMTKDNWKVLGGWHVIGLNI